MNFLCMALNSLSRFPQYSKRSGFTLVELAIVLVIVGLLIGGILVAQSMISTAKINSQIKQFQQFDAAVANFITRYKAIPGDARALYTSAQADLVYNPVWGDNIADDGKLAARGYGAEPYWAFDYWSEFAYFWPQLNIGVGFTQNGASFSENVLAADRVTTCASNCFNITASVRNSPQAQIESKTGIIAGSTIARGNLSGTISVYQLGNYSAIGTTNMGSTGVQVVGQPSITPIQGLAIDKKMDDGLPLAGFVQAVGFGGGALNLAGDAPSASCVAASAYNTTDTKSCGIIVQIMSQSAGIPGRGTTY